jgi:uncharacterized protein (DUF58 family)
MSTLRLFDRQVLRRIFNRIDTDAGPVTLDRKRVFILPTRYGLVFGLALIFMLIGSINYTLSLGFALTFLLGGMALVSILHTYRNLIRVRVYAGKVPPVFAGQSACYSICLENGEANERYAIGLMRDKQQPQFIDLAAKAGTCAELSLPARRRGWLKLGPFTLFSRFPVGLFHAWSKLELDELVCLVYPQPDNARLPPLTGVQGGGDMASVDDGSDDFRGLRPYHPGDSLRHVAWKAMAREQGMRTKQFNGQARPELWLDWSDLGALDTEARLSRLTRWVLDAEEAGLSYGLRIPGAALAPSHGDTHRRACLETLALYDNGAIHAAPDQAR